MRPSRSSSAATAIAALLLTPVALYRGELRPAFVVWAPLLAYTAVEVAIPWVLLARAETKLTSSLTGLLIAAVPLVGALVVTLTGECERLGGRSWLGLLIGIAGVAAIVGLDVGQVNGLALVEVACVAVGYAVGPIISRAGSALLPRSESSPPRSQSRRSCMRRSRRPTGPTRAPSAHVLESVVGLAVVCTALAFLLFFALIAHVGPVRATVITYVNPAVAAVLGVAVLGEHITVGMVIGFALVLVGCVLATGRGPDAVAES